MHHISNLYSNDPSCSQIAPRRSFDIQGDLLRSKRLFGSVLEQYHYAISGNVLYEYIVPDDKKNGLCMKHSYLKMVVPLANLEITHNVGRDIVLKPKGASSSIPVATKSIKFGVEQAINNIREAVSHIGDRNNAAESERERMAAKPLSASSRQEIVLSPSGDDDQPSLESWAAAIEAKTLTFDSKKHEKNTSVYIEGHGMSYKDKASLCSSLISELNKLDCNEGGKVTLATSSSLK